MKMVLSGFRATDLLYGTTMVGTRFQILYMLTSQQELALVIQQARTTFEPMKPVLAMTCITSCRHFSRGILNLPEMISSLLENLMLATISPLLLLESTRETKTEKESR
uniref:Uncharacterized protein n=1 Tax=Rhizophora mucronata TaxID=61149 RepID=A0A2P2QXH1_RHIMU